MSEDKIRNASVDTLFSAMLKLESIEECYMFFEDLCTVNELHSLAQRYDVAKKLSQGLTYQQIAAETGASTATISRINRCLTYGADGYQMMISREKKDKHD